MLQPCIETDPLSEWSGCHSGDIVVDDGVGLRAGVDEFPEMALCLDEVNETADGVVDMTSFQV